MFLPPGALEPFTTRARLLIKNIINVTRIYDEVLIDAAEAVNSDPELMKLWNTWYSIFNPSDQIYGPEIRRGLLSKLINSALGVVLKEVNARYTTLAKNKKLKFTLREELKVTTSNLGGGGSKSKAFHPFNSVIAGLVGQQQSVIVGDVSSCTRAESPHGGTASKSRISTDTYGRVPELEEGLYFDAMLVEYEREIYGDDDIALPTATEEAAAGADGDDEDSRGEAGRR